MKLFDCDDSIWNNTWNKMIDIITESTEISIWVFSPARKTIESCIWNSVLRSTNIVIKETINEMSKDE